MKTRKYVVESTEEELGSDLFEITVPNTETEEKVYTNFEIASLFATGWDLVDRNYNEAVEEYPIIANITEELYEDCVTAREGGNGIDAFNNYLECCGYKVKELTLPSPDFTYEW